MPTKSEINVAVPEIWSERQVIDHTSASRTKTSSTALRKPCQITSISRPQLFFLLIRNRHKQSLAELFDAKTLDQVLCFCRDHEISESSAGGLIHARSVGRVHFHHGID